MMRTRLSRSTIVGPLRQLKYCGGYRGWTEGRIAAAPLSSGQRQLTKFKPHGIRGAWSRIFAGIQTLTPIYLALAIPTAARSTVAQLLISLSIVKAQRPHFAAQPSEAYTRL